ncbi:MAG: hypothetical protein RL017_185 [Pseudomonadota bacterium]|jgi:hypothetical protein
MKLVFKNIMVLVGLTIFVCNQAQAWQSSDMEYQYQCGVNAVCGHVDGLDSGTITVAATGTNGLEANYAFVTNVSNGDFVLPMLSARSGQQYAVSSTNTLLTNKSNVCQVSGNPFTFGTSNKIKIDCNVHKAYTIGGQIIGLINGEKVVIQTLQTGNIQNSGIYLGNGDFTFSMPVPDKTSYSATIAWTQTVPAERNCMITNDKGTVNESDITDIIVDCTIKK